MVGTLKWMGRKGYFYLISKHCIIAININPCVSTVMLLFASSHPEFLEHVRYFL